MRANKDLGKLCTLETPQPGKAGIVAACNVDTVESTRKRLNCQCGTSHPLSLSTGTSHRQHNEYTCNGLTVVSVFPWGRGGGVV